MTALRSALACILCLLLASWSAEAALMQTLSKSGRGAFKPSFLMSKHAPHDDEEDNEHSDAKADSDKESDSDEDDEDDDQAESTKKEEPEENEKLRKAEDLLESNHAKQDQLEKRMSEVKGMEKSDEEIESVAKLVANETESSALASMLGNMWSEQRMFRIPTYLDYLEEEQKNLKADEVELKAKVEAAKNGTSDDKEAKKAVKDDKDEKLESTSKKSLLQKAHRDFAMGMVVTIVMLSTFLMMASSSNASLSKSTWSTIDFVVVHFLAISWFIVVKHGLDYFKLAGLERIIVHAVVSVAFLLASLLISWRMKVDDEKVGIFNGIFTPMVMWVNAGFVQTVQQHATTPTMVLVHTLGLMVWYAFLSFLFYHLVRKTLEEKWGDATVDTMTGAVLAGSFVLWAHMEISGAYQELSGAHSNPPTFRHTMIMLALSVVYFGLALVVKPRVDTAQKNAESTKYWTARVLAVVSTFLCFLPYYSMAMGLGHLIIENWGYGEGAIAARLNLAVVNTVIAIIFIFIATRLRSEIITILTGLGGFMMGVAWVGLLNNSCDMFLKGDGLSDPFPYKLGLTALITVFLFPAYSLYLKPIIMQKTA